MRKLTTYSAGILLCIILSFRASAQNEDLMFHHLGTSDGLSNDYVTALMRDSRGFLWVCTEFGINRYDGYSFTVYTKNNSDILNDKCHTMVEDPNGNVWFRAENGFSVYDADNDCFSCDTRPYLDNLLISINNVQNVGTSPDGDFWAYGQTRLSVKDSESGQVETYAVSPASSSKISVSSRYVYYQSPDNSIIRIDRISSEKTVFALPEDLYGESRFYVDLNEGIWVYEFIGQRAFYMKNGLKEWSRIDFGDYTVAYNRLQDLKDMGDNNLWVSTTHLGLFIYNYQTGQIRQYLHSPNRFSTLLSNNLSTIYRDREGIVWIGYFKNGLTWVSPSGQTIYSKSNQLESDVGCFLEREDGEGFFYGTDGDGVMLNTNALEKDKVITSKPNIIVRLASDSRGRLWLASFGNGLCRYSDGGERKWTVLNSAIADNNVYGIDVTPDESVWIGTLNGVVQRFTPSTEEFETIFSFNDATQIRHSFFDNGIIYYATTCGILIVDTGTLSVAKKKGIFLDNYIRTIFKDSRGLLWLGHSGGLSIWNPADDNVQIIRQSDGLVSGYITAISEDDYGRMWVGTGNGVTCITPNASGHYTMMNITDRDGLVSNSINDGAAYKLSNGNIVFGTQKGYSIVVPRKQVDKVKISPVRLTGIDVDNAPSDFSPAKGENTLYDTSALIFPARYNSFTLSFSTLDMAFYNQIAFEYRMDGSESWVRLDDNTLRLTSLHSGRHTLKVRPVLKGGEIGAEEEFALTVRPHWWLSTSSKIIWLLLICGIVAMVLKNYRDRKERERKYRELEEENRRQKEIGDMKAKVFTNISHELRTPLSLIINPLENYLEENPAARSSELSMVKHNADYLLELVNQILDFRRLSSIMTTSDVVYEDIVEELHDAFSSFEAIASGRGITYTFSSNEESCHCSYDRSAIRKICNNILSNAFKFTPDSGSISLELKFGDGDLEMLFSDTGRGISDYDKEHIFERFYQSSSNTANDGGSGIGLHIVSECIKKMGGSISIRDNSPKGTVFTVNIPLDIEDETAPAAAEGGPSILLVDDNPEFLGFMAKSLSPQYTIYRALNGSQALNILNDTDIDLVVSDVMMPETDGLQLCSAIKNDIRFSHIPVILLTGKAGNESELEGLSAGADDYLSKPFNMKILKARIENLINSSIERRKLFSESIIIEPNKLSLTPLDKDFVQKAIQLVEDNMTDSNFSVENLAEGLNLSRSYFSSKFMKVTGQKPIDFIRSIRMRHAKQLLEESQRPVSEIAYMLGYKNPKLFSVHFKEEFGKTPTDFKKENNK